MIQVFCWSELLYQWWITNFLIFQPIFNTFAMHAGFTETIVAWKMKKGLSNKNIRSLKTVSNSLSRKLKRYNLGMSAELKGSCLKQDKVNFASRVVISLFTVYELDRWSQDFNTDFTIKDYLFGAVKLTETADPDKHSYSGYGIVFDSSSLFLILIFRGENVVIFVVENSS